MNSNNKVVKLLSELIQFQSVTPDTSDCQKYIHNYLSESNFKTEYKKYSNKIHKVLYHIWVITTTINCYFFTEMLKFNRL